MVERWDNIAYFLAHLFMGFFIALCGIKIQGEKKENLMELLKKEKCVWVSMEPQQRQDFLMFAKNSGFKWFTGKEISLDEDCWLTVAMFDDMTIANIPAMHRVFGSDSHTVYKVNFTDLCIE